MRLQRTLFSVCCGFTSVEPLGYTSLWIKHQFFGNFLFIHSPECCGPQGWELTAFLLLHSSLVWKLRSRMPRGATRKKEK